MIMRAINLAGGIYQLLRLGLITRFRFKGPYWEWRNQTAFGRGMPESRTELLRSVLEYGIWMHQMRSGR